MSRSRKGGFVKDGLYTEVRMSRNYSYEDFLAAADEALEIEVDTLEEEDPELLLFRTDGTIVPNRPILYGNTEQPWTLDAYLKSMKKTAAQVKLGVGYCRTKVRN